METFLEQKQTSTQNDSMCNRVIRKKFRCIMLFMLTIIFIAQLLFIVFDKIDEKYINKLFEVATSNKSKSIFASLLRNFGESNNTVEEGWNNVQHCFGSEYRLHEIRLENLYQIWRTQTEMKHFKNQILNQISKNVNFEGLQVKKHCKNNSLCTDHIANT